MGRLFLSMATLSVASCLLAALSFAIEVQATHGGDSFETAVPLELNRAYHLDHHQKIGYFDYFTVELTPGEEFILELDTGDKGINLRGPTPVETNTPYAGAVLYNRLRQKIGGLNISGRPRDSQSLRYNPEEAGLVYVVIGSTFDDMNKDHTLFQLKLVSRGDLNSDQDAGDSLTEAAAMQAQRYETNYLGAADLKDVYSFHAKKGESYFVGLIPNEDAGSVFVLTVYDNYKQKIFSKTSGLNEGLKSKQFTIPDDGTYYIEITLGTPLKQAVPYTLELKRTSGPQPVTPPKPVSKPKPLPKPMPQPTKTPPPKEPVSEPAAPNPLEDEGPRAMPTPTELPAEPQNPTP